MRSQEFRKVYDQGVRITGSLFAAFCLRQPEAASGSRVGFTAPRALGGAVARNRIKRRLREAVRAKRLVLGDGWLIVINPRRRCLEAPFSELEREVERLFRRCAALSPAPSDGTNS